MHARLHTLTACALALLSVPALDDDDGVRDMTAAPLAIGGRHAPLDHDIGFQWPGMYFETAFRGNAFAVSVGKGETILRVFVDGEEATTLAKPRPGKYRIDGLPAGDHVVRVAVATESQAGPDRFDGILLPPDAVPLPLPRRERRIEFIGDSHTVGYGNLSTTRQCTPDEVWSRTDNTRAYGPLVAAHYDADYRVHAISGRGVVRNYDGFAGDTLPQAYPYVLFDHSVRDKDDGWQPQAIVIALGTNDFSTALHAGERWASRDALHADYEATFAGFVRSLRARHPQARIVLWATNGAEGEVQAEVQKVVARLQDAYVSYLPVDGLAMDGCDWHPSEADHRRIADALVRHLDALPAPWGAK